ncbi:hypothetical protein KUCAC02_010925 [Chaenocephalus aceratus]|uniref:Uncharacterized protein n=1 Tax=Chaenocephalus aceratus TaxID=36190 RepID=A0ACB9WVZ3_CHAAC|nr:hypothetical protein KUCAC02_010925 [Chaenocephalus aceratus]
MFLISSVQQDRRAPADRFLRTPIFPPLEGALTPPSSRVSTSSLDNSCWMVKLSSMASTPTEHTLANEEAAELRSCPALLSPQSPSGSNSSSPSLLFLHPTPSPPACEAYWFPSYSEHLVPSLSPLPTTSQVSSSLTCPELSFLPISLRLHPSVPSSSYPRLLSAALLYPERGPWSQQLPVSQKTPLFSPSVFPPLPPHPPPTPLWYIPSLSPGAFLTDLGRLRSPSVSVRVELSLYSSVEA